MTTKLSPVLAISALVIHAGCAFDGGIDGEIIEPDATLLQPVAITTSSQTTNHEYDGIGRTGTEILGRDARGTSRDGQELTQLGLTGSAFASAVVESGQVLIGDELVGATFRTVTQSQEPIDIRIEASDPQMMDTLSDKAVQRYTIAFSLVREPGWRYACGVDEARMPIKAIPLEGLWDYGSGVPGGGSRREAPGWITFACEGFALARCVGLGYLPWNFSDGTSLGLYHQACTRMMRADYCGDGQGHSQDGVLINVYDARGIQPAPALPFLTGVRVEAEWTERGARCARRSREAGYFPECNFELSPKVCGKPPHWDHTLLVSEIW